MFNNASLIRFEPHEVGYSESTTCTYIVTDSNSCSTLCYLMYDFGEKTSRRLNTFIMMNTLNDPIRLMIIDRKIK